MSDGWLAAKLYLATGCCFTFMVIEFVAGFLAHSLAIMTDGAHLFTDVTAFGLAIAASFLSEKKASSTHSYGYRRFEVLSSLTSTLFIWVLTGILVWEAMQRIWEFFDGDMEPVDGKLMFTVAVLGIFVNLAMERILGGHDLMAGGIGGHGHSHGGHEHGHGHDEEVRSLAAALTARAC